MKPIIAYTHIMEIPIIELYAIISQKPPLSGPTRRRYLPRIASILRHTEEGCKPKVLPKSTFEIYGLSSINLNIAIRLSDNFSPLERLFSINLSTLLVIFRLFSEFAPILFQFGSVRFQLPWAQRSLG